MVHKSSYESLNQVVGIAKKLKDVTALDSTGKSLIHLKTMKNFYKLSNKIDKVKLDDHERFAKERYIAR